MTLNYTPNLHSLFFYDSFKVFSSEDIQEIFSNTELHFLPALFIMKLVMTDYLVLVVLLLTTMLEIGWLAQAGSALFSSISGINLSWATTCLGIFSTWFSSWIVLFVVISKLLAVFGLQAWFMTFNFLEFNFSLRRDSIALPRSETKRFSVASLKC